LLLCELVREDVDESDMLYALPNSVRELVWCWGQLASEVLRSDGAEHCAEGTATTFTCNEYLVWDLLARSLCYIHNESFAHLVVPSNVTLLLRNSMFRSVV